MLTTFTGICNLFTVTASVWWMLQLFDGLFTARRTGRRGQRERMLLMLFTILFHWAELELSRNLSIGDEILLPSVLAVMSMGVHLVYDSRYADIVCINILGWGMLILAEFLLQAGLHILHGGQGTQQGSELYLAATGVLLLCSGIPLKRWIADKKYLVFRYQKICYLLVFVMLPSIFYAIWIYRLRRDGRALEGWFLLPLYGMAAFFFFRFSAIKHRIEETERAQQRKIDMLEGNYRMLLEVYREREIHVHDMKNHMRAIETMLESAQVESAVAYIRQIVGDMNRGAKIAWTNHEMLDMVLNMKFQEARKEQIEVQCRCDDMSGLLLSSAEICALFANLLDNAIEANVKCPPDMGRRITVLCMRREAMLVVSVSNLTEERKPGQGGPDLETSKQDKDEHGFGLYSIQKVLDSHDGYRKVSVTEREFRIVVYLVGFEL